MCSCSTMTVSFCRMKKHVSSFCSWTPHILHEARDAWLDNRNADMWTQEDDVANHLMLKEELHRMKKSLCVAVGVICILFVVLVNTWLM